MQDLNKGTKRLKNDVENICFFFLKMLMIKYRHTVLIHPLPFGARLLMLHSLVTFVAE